MQGSRSTRHRMQRSVDLISSYFPVRRVPGNRHSLFRQKTGNRFVHPTSHHKILSSPTLSGVLMTPCSLTGKGYHVFPPLSSTRPASPCPPAHFRAAEMRVSLARGICLGKSVERTNGAENAFTLSHKNRATDKALIYPMKSPYRLPFSFTQGVWSPPLSLALA